MTITIFDRDYSAEALPDLAEDIDYIFAADKTKHIPTDKYGMHEGIFRVTIEWRPTEEDE